MPKFKAEFAVKYRGENHFANEWFDIDAADAEEMRRYGVVVEDAATPAPKAVQNEEPKKRKKKTN